MRLRMFIAAALATLLLTSCSSGDDDSSTPSGGTGPADQVTYLTAFGITGRESYVHAAIDQGYFRDENIQVTVKAGQAGPFNENAITSGQAQFASVDSTGMFTRAAAKKPADRNVKAIAAVHQRTLLSLVTLNDRKISTPSDLIGRKIGTTKGSAPQVMWPLYADLAKVPRDSVTFVDAKPEALIGLLIAGRVDAIGLFVAGIPQLEAAEAKVAKEQNRAPRTAVPLPYSQYLTDLYGAVLVTSGKILAEKPDLARRFTRALMRGLEYAVTHPQEGGKILAKTDAKINPAAAAGELARMAPYTEPPGGEPYGYMDDLKVAKQIAIMKQLPIADVVPAELVDFTFVPGVEGAK